MYFYPNAESPEREPGNEVDAELMIFLQVMRDRKLQMRDGSDKLSYTTNRVPRFKRGDVLQARRGDHAMLYSGTQ